MASFNSISCLLFLTVLDFSLSRGGGGGHGGGGGGGHSGGGHGGSGGHSFSFGHSSSFSRPGGFSFSHFFGSGGGGLSSSGHLGSRPFHSSPFRPSAFRPSPFRPSAYRPSPLLHSGSRLPPGRPLPLGGVRPVPGFGTRHGYPPSFTYWRAPNTAIIIDGSMPLGPGPGPWPVGVGPNPMFPGQLGQPPFWNGTGNLNETNGQESNPFATQKMSPLDLKNATWDPIQMKWTFTTPTKSNPPNSTNTSNERTNTLK